MPLSIRLMGALAMAALAPRPARPFLSPINAPTLNRHGCHVSPARSPAAGAFRRRISPQQQRRSDGPARRRGVGSCGGLMMAKKKNRNKGTKKPNDAGAPTSTATATVAVPAAVGTPKGDAANGRSGPAASNAEGVGGGTAAAEILVPSAETEAGAEEGGAASAQENEAFQTRKVGQTANADDYDLNGSSTPKKPTPSGGGTKGFGTPAPSPKPVQKGVNKAPKQPPTKPVMAQDEGKQVLPPPRQPAGGMDALAPGIPVTGTTDHQKVITEAEFSSPEPVTAALPVTLTPKTEGGGEEEQMSPAEMLKYLRDNNLSIDLETLNPVEVPRDPAAKVEAIFPFPAANVKAKYYLGSSPKPSEFVNAILPLLPEDEPWNGRKIRPLPDLKDFMVANRLHGGSRGMSVITSLMFKAMSAGDLERAKDLRGAAICMTKAENAIAGPFRQAVMFAESRMAPCMGSTLCEEYAGQDAADAAATWVVLKACVAEWELRLRECRQEDVGLHDIFRSLPSPTEGLDEERIASITGSVQAMGQSFRNNAKLMEVVPAEIRFMEGALGLNTTTEVRRFALQDFCPQEGMSPEDLRFRVSSLICGLEQLPSKSYHQLQVAAADVYGCLTDGTPDEYNIYTDNWKGGEDLSFQTYRLETGERWRNKLREIVTSPVPQRQEESDSYDKLFKEMLPQSLWRLVNDEGERGEPPFVMLEKGWWESLDYLDEGKVEEKRKREAAIEAAKMKDPDLVQEGDEEEEADDIFGDFETEERKKMSEFVLPKDFETGEGKNDIRDGPGPGMEELDIFSITWAD